MKKKVILLILALAMMLSVSAFAVEQRSSYTPSLSFSGTTATCSITVMKPGATIDVTLELWCGNTPVGSWSDSDTSSVIISKTCKVTRGNTYTLIASGTINGVPFESDPVVKTCK